MKRSQFLVYLVFALLMLIPSTIGQDGAEVIEPQDPDMMNPAAHISYPPPVYVVRDSVDIRGTVTLATMRNFFIEFRPLVLDEMAMTDDEEDHQWFPATLPRIEAVAGDVLGSWNTVTLRDGLYELRLTINIGGDMPEYFRVSPIRVENNPPPFAAEQQVMAAPEPTPTPEPSPTPVDTSPRVIATVDSNVRKGDSTQYQVIGHLLTGDSAKIKGISSYGTGWYYIELSSGRRGFIHPNIVRAEGDLSNVPRINPPPLPPTPIPLPTAVPPPPSSGADLVFTSVVISPHPAKCKQAYEIRATVRNAGTAPTNSGGLIEVKDTRYDGAGLENTQIAFGQLAAGISQTVVGHITATQYFDELHHINLYLDSNNQVPEANEGNNHHATSPYILKRGKC